MVELNELEQDLYDGLPDLPVRANDPSTWPKARNAIQERAQEDIRGYLSGLERVKAALRSNGSKEAQDLAARYLQWWDDHMVEQWMTCASPTQADVFEEYLTKDSDIVFVLGPNRAGKTASAALGFCKWIRDEAPDDADVWCISPESSVSKRGIQKLLWDLLPKHCFSRKWTKTTGFGSKDPNVLCTFGDRTIHITFIDETQFDNNRKKIEASSVDRLFIDESVGEAVWAALVLRTADAEDGKICGATIANEDWMYDGVQNSIASTMKVFHVDVRDNPVLTKRKYLKILETVPEHERDVRIRGKFNIENSRVFQEFDESRHVIPYTDGLALCEKYNAQWWAGMDFGWDHPTCWLLIGSLVDGRVIVLDEYSARGTRVDEDVPEILAILGDRTLHLGDTLCDPSGSSVTKQNPVSLIEQYNNLGLPCCEAMRTQVAGEKRQIHELRNMLANDTLLMTTRCKLLARNMRMWRKKRDRHNQPLGQGGDPNEDRNNDGIDTLRYGVGGIWHEFGSFTPPVSNSA